MARRSRPVGTLRAFRDLPKSPGPRLDPTRERLLRERFPSVTADPHEWSDDAAIRLIADICRHGLESGVGRGPGKRGRPTAAEYDEIRAKLRALLFGEMPVEADPPPRKYRRSA